MNTQAAPSSPPASTASTAPAAWRDDARVIALVGMAHGLSHYSQLLLAPLFPWLKEVFGVSYAQLGFLLTVFFVTSCVVQAVSGFWVDRHGPRPILFAGLALLGTAALGYAASTSYAMLALFSVLAGIGNGVFHPVDYTLLNRKIAPARLGHAYSVHGITGSLGWALAPAMLVPLTLACSWRVALACAAGLIFAVLALLLWQRRHLQSEPAAVPLQPAAMGAGAARAVEGPYDFLKIPAVWMCFAFFFVYAGALSIIQSFAPEAARQLHGVPAQLVAGCLSIYMVCSASGMVLGGFLAADPQRCERVVGAGFSIAALFALAMAFADVPGGLVPLLFGVIGFSSGIAGPSRDLLVKRATPPQSSGRVYGVVYAGLDIGQALVPLLIGRLMDLQQYQTVWITLAALQALLIVSAFRVQRVRRTALQPA